MQMQNPKEAIEAIKKENLTGRQLRMARRLANKQGLSPRSDLDAVRLLRDAGIEPFSPGEIGTSEPPQEKIQVPSTESKLQAPPPTEFSPENRELQIRKIQLDLVRRRRKRIFAALAKVFAFVALPTILAGFYFSKMATPIFTSHSQLVVQTTTGSSVGGGGLGASLFATAQESVNVQKYIESRPVMLRLDEDYGFRELFEDPAIDPLQRLDPEASNEDAYKLYGKRVKLSYDPTEGVIGLEVSTPDPVASFEISNILRDYAEVHVGNMTSRASSDQMKGAREALAEAEENLAKAREDVLRLQSEKGIISGEVEISFLIGEINAMQTERNALEIDLEELQSNPRPNQARVDAIVRQMTRLDTRIAENRQKLTDGSEREASLTRIQSELAAAELDLQLRQALVAQAFEGLELARQSSGGQSIYLNRAVEPVIADAKSYPKVFENTMLAFLVFAGIYLMISLTFSILREQMTT